MGLRTRAILLGVASLLVSPLGLALGLGEVKVNSHLNQPLEAEIQLLQTRELSAQEILVGLGTQEDFTRVGVDRPFFLNDLKFTVDMENKGGPVIRITSTRLVREPFLNFIIQAQWPSGKLLREYTVLLDLPLFGNEPARTVQAAKAQAPSARPAPAQQRQPAPRQAAARTSSGFDGDTYGPVSATDTLWSIASKARPGDDVSVQQTMLAIQRLNPDAFINNNINLLKKGAVLRLPSEQDVAEFDVRDAKREVATQNRSIREASTEPQIDATRSTVERGGQQEQIKGRVKLSSAADITGSRSGSGSGEGQQDADAMRTQLLTTREELASTQRENEDLKARVVAMDEQVQTMEKLLEVANSDLRKFELALQEQQKAEPADNTESTTTAVTTEPVTSGETEPAETSVVESVPNETPITETPVTETPVAENPVEAQPAEVTPPPTSNVASPYSAKKSFMDIIMENLLYVGGALVLIIGGVVYFLLTRNRGFDEDDFEYEEDETADPIAASYAQDAPADFTVDLTPATQDADDEITLESLGSQLLNSELSTSDDPFDAIDNHIAMGEYTAALASLDEVDADVTAIQLKRLEIFAKQDDLSSFDAQFKAFEADASAADIERAKNFRGLISSALLIGGAAAIAYDEDAEADYDELDTTLRFDAITEADIEAAALETAVDDDFTVLEKSGPDTTALDELSLDNLDISLDLDLDDKDDDDLDLLAEEGSEPSEEGISSDLDFEDFGADSLALNDDTQELEFSLDDDALNADSLSLDLESDAGLDDDSKLELDIEIRDSQIEEESDELDLTNLSLGVSGASDADLTLGDDLALDDDLSLGDDLELSLDDGLLLNVDDDESIADSFGADTDDTLLSEGNDEPEDALSLEDFIDELSLGDDLETEEAGEFEGLQDAERELADDIDTLDELDVDLESLDQELDLLSSGFDGDLADIDSELAAGDIAGALEVTPEALTDDEVADLDVELPAFDPDSDDDTEPSFLGDSDEVATKIDLLRVFVDMGDTESALNTLEEIREEGNAAQKKEAEALFANMA